MIKKVSYCIMFIFYLQICYLQLFCFSNSNDKDYMTREAYKFFTEYVSGNPKKFFSKNSLLQYCGCAGDYQKFDCRFNVTLTLSFDKYNINGECRYSKNLIIKVKGFEDNFNNILLVEHLKDGNTNYIFKGKHIGGQIAGMWSKGSGKKEFVMNVNQCNNPS